MAKQVSAPQPDITETPATDAEKPVDKGVAASDGAVVVRPHDQAVRPHDQNVIELAIERALNDVRAEIEATSAEVAKAEAAKRDDAVPAAAPDTEAQPAEAAIQGHSDPQAVPGGEISTSGEAEPQPIADVTPKDSGGQPGQDLVVPDAVPTEPLPAQVPAAETMTDEPPAATEAAPFKAPPPDATPPETRQPNQPLTHMLARVTPPASMEKLEMLEEAVASAGGPPLSQTVEDTVRPIVREWLANNLPPMVERIIREEIERVSRSGV